MELTPALALIPLFALTANVLIQWFTARLQWPLSKTIASGVLAGLLVCFLRLATLSTQTEASGVELFCGWALAVLSYLALSFGYWAFLNLNITSLRIRILRELHDAPEKNITPQTLMQRYAPAELLERRLSRLERSGDIRLEDGKWRLGKRRLLRIQQVIAILRRLIIASP